MPNNISLSFVIPVKDEEASVAILVNEISLVMDKIKENSYEIIFIDDGSTDKTYQVLKSLHLKNKNVKAYKLRGNFGKSIALSVGFSKAKGEVIFSLDGDLQDNPNEIPRFLEKIKEGYDLVSGWKKLRRDPLFTKVIPSRIFNFMVRFLTRVDIHDTNCGFKAYKKEVIENLSLYGDLYRFIPIIAAKQQFKVAEIVVEHRIRKFGVSKYGWTRMIRGLLDLITVVFLTGYLKRPGHFFGSLGIISFSTGFIVGLYITYLRLSTGSIQDRHPLLYLGMLLMIVGVQLVSTGLLAEMMAHWQQENKKEKVISASLS
jgi:glycosyltransferase involved in cell wall biosynthesis